MLNESSLNRKGLQSGSIFALILLTTSLLSTSYVQNSKALVQEDHEDYGYLKFASYAVKQAYAAKQNSTVNSTIHIPAIAMGPSSCWSSHETRYSSGCCYANGVR